MGKTMAVFGLAFEALLLLHDTERSPSYRVCAVLAIGPRRLEKRRMSCISTSSGRQTPNGVLDRSLVELPQFRNSTARSFLILS